MLAHAGERGTDRRCALVGAKFYEIDDGEVAVLRWLTYALRRRPGRRKEGRCSRAIRTIAPTRRMAATITTRGLRWRARKLVDEELVDMAMEDGGDLADFVGEGGEFFGEDRLHAVGEGFVRFVVDFDEQAVGADGDRGAARAEGLCGACRCRAMGSTRIGRWLRFLRRGRRRDLECCVRSRRRCGRRVRRASRCSCLRTKCIRRPSEIRRAWRTCRA